MDIAVTLLLMVLCLIAEGFFSGSEIGIVSADQMKLRHDAAKGSRGARLALEMLKKPEWLLSTTLVGTNIAVVANTTLATALMIQLFGERGGWLAIVLVAPLIWVFGEIVPKSVFQQRANEITPSTIFVLKAASYLFSPILVVFAFLTRIMTRVFGGADVNPFTLREEIITMLEMPAGEGDIQPLETTMIRRLFGFSEITVQEVMVPLIDVYAVEKGMSRGEAIRVAVENNHVRLPVYEERVDRIVGILHVLDLLGLDPEHPIESDVREVSYVPEAKSGRNLLLEFRQQGDVVAVVVDEFGGATGLVTIEDIMEAVVEDMEDEYDAELAPAPWIRRISDQEYLISARVELGQLEERLGVEFPEGDYVTVGGFLLSRAGEVPEKGAVIRVEELTFVVEQATPQAIQEVRVHLP